MKFSAQFKKSFSYTWYLYLLALILPSIAFPLAFSFKNRAKDHQVLSVFLPTELKVENANSKLYEDLKGLNIKAADIVCADPNLHKLVFEQKVTIVAYTKCDVIILPEDRLEEVLIFTQALILNDEVKNLCKIAGEKMYTNEENNYGVEIPSDSPFMAYGNFDTNMKYYAFLNKKSVNIGNYSLKSPHTENAFSLMQFALGKYEK